MSEQLLYTFLIINIWVQAAHYCVYRIKSWEMFSVSTIIYNLTIFLAIWWFWGV